MDRRTIDQKRRRHAPVWPGAIAAVVLIALVATAGTLDRPEQSATPAPSQPPDALFVADAETGDSSQWCYVHSAVPISTVTDPVRAGQHAYRSEIQDGELIYGTERSEYSNGPDECDRHLFREGDETWTAISVYLPADFPRYASWSLVAQWKEPDGGTPPSQINLEDEAFAIVGSDLIDPRPLWVVADVERGRWIDFLLHHRWSTDPSIGFVEAFVDGQRVLPRTFTRTMDNENPLFLSVGHYRDEENSGTAVVYIDEVRVGRTRSSVEPPSADGS